MGKIITYNARPIPANGLHKSPLQRQKLKQFLFDDLTLLKTLPTLPPPTATPTLFYPGSGCDILLPLLYIEKIFPKLREIHCHFHDVYNFLPTIKTIVHDIGISFAEESSPNQKIHFYWDELLVHLSFTCNNVFSSEIKPHDIYFEKAFRIIKEQHPTYEQKIFTKLNLGGILISDSGFQTIPLHTYPANPELSTYREFIIGIKDMTQRT